MNKNKNVIILIAVIFVGLGSGTGIMYLAGTVPILNDYNDLEVKYDNLEEEYGNLTEDYNNLFGNYSNLENDYNNLLGDYGGLLSEYDDLTEDYNNLFANFESLWNIYNILNSPLNENYSYPTVDNVLDWLWDIDDTDESEYIESVWMCGDFASMLMTRAKLMGWRMRIACMFYSEEGDAGWLNPNDIYGEYGHAFNIILCQDYDGDGTLDWIYIEPQTDAAWWVGYGSDIYVHYRP